jgi:hypothetical protein
MITCKRNKKGLRRLKTSKYKKTLRGGNKEEISRYNEKIKNNEILQYEDIQKIIGFNILNPNHQYKKIFNHYLERLWNDMKEIELLDYLKDYEILTPREKFYISYVEGFKLKYLNNKKVIDFYNDKQKRNHLLMIIGGQLSKSHSYKNCSLQKNDEFINPEFNKEEKKENPYDNLEPGHDDAEGNYADVSVDEE